MLVDCITGLPISEITTTADVADSNLVENILSQTNDFLSIDECTFIADKGYDAKAAYDLVKDVYHGECVIPLNKRNTKNPKKLPSYVTLPNDYRLSIDRDCVTFKKIYAMRTEAERYNSLFKSTGQERLWIHCINAAKNLNSIAHIALLAVAVSAVGDYFTFRNAPIRNKENSNPHQGTHQSETRNAPIRTRNALADGVTTE